MSRRRRTDQLALFDEPKCKRCGHPTTSPVCWCCIETLRSMSAWDIEWWIEAPGWDGHLVSNLGQIRSTRQMGKLLKQSIGSGGYPGVGRVRVHVLVARSFLGPPPPGLEVCHYDGIKTDNRLFQLRYDNRSGNIADSIRHGTHPWASKTHCPKGHPYDDVNTLVCTRGNGHRFRLCRACIRSRKRKKAEAAS